jgi:acyl dehydratase
MGYVTDAHRALIDRKGAWVQAHAPISEDALRRFMQAVMDDDPTAYDPAAAARAGYDGIVAPPLFPLHALRRPSGSPDPLDRLVEDPAWDASAYTSLGDLPSLDLPLLRLLNGGTAAEFFKLARVGDTIRVRSWYADIFDREGGSGPMVVVVVETEYVNQGDELLVRVRNTLIWR